MILVPFGGTLVVQDGGDVGDGMVVSCDGVHTDEAKATDAVAVK